MVRIEKIGKDILDFRIPDNSGRQVLGSRITGNGDLMTSCELKRWDVSSWNIPTRISEMQENFFVMRYIIGLLTPYARMIYKMSSEKIYLVYSSICRIMPT